MSSGDIIGLLVIAVVLFALVRILFWPKRARKRSNSGSNPSWFWGPKNHDGGGFDGGDGGGGGGD